MEHPSLLHNAIHHLHGLPHIHHHPLDPSDNIVQQNHFSIQNFLPPSNKDELKPKNTQKTKTLPEKTSSWAPKLPQSCSNQQIQLTIELESEDVNQKSFNTSGTSHISTCGEDDAHGHIAPDGLRAPVVCIIQDVQNKHEFNTLSTYRGTLINWQSPNNLQYKEEFKGYVNQCIYKRYIQVIRFHILPKSRQHSQVILHYNKNPKKTQPHGESFATLPPQTIPKSPGQGKRFSQRARNAIEEPSLQISYTSNDWLVHEFSCCIVLLLHLPSPGIVLQEDPAIPTQLIRPIWQYITRSGMKW